MTLIRLFEQLTQDLKYAIRAIAAQPLFTSMAVLSLALGIGANTAIYSFMDSILVRSLPVHQPESLVVFNWHSKSHPAVAHNFSGGTFRDSKTGYTSGNFPYPAFDLLRRNKTLFSSVFAFNSAGRPTLQVQGQADLGITQYVSGEFFSGLGIPPTAGRLIDDNDNLPGAPSVAVVSYGFAQRHFGDVANAVGQRISISNSPFTIVGVAAPEFFGVNPEAARDLYVPMHADQSLEKVFIDEVKTKYVDQNFYWVEIMARLRPGVTREQALAVLAPQFQQFITATAGNDKERADLPALLVQEGAGGLASLRRQFSKPLYVLLTLVGLILAIACANIANLLLARSSSRRREFAVRLSLGAARSRLIRQLLTESLLLAGAGGLLGIAFAKLGISALTFLIANGRDNFTLNAVLNWRVLVLTLALSVATGIMFGLAPALQSVRVDLVSGLKQTRAGEHSRQHPWLRLSLTQLLAVSQIGISFLLLVAAGLFGHTLANLNSVSLGFNQEKMLLVTVNARQAGYQDAPLMRFYSALQNRFAAIPGVRSVTFSSDALVADHRSTTILRLPGDSSAARSVTILNIGASFFSTMQIPILLGREVEQRDVDGPVHAAVVNEMFVKNFLGGANPIGKHFQLGGDKSPVDFEIIGVAKNSRVQSLKQDIPPLAFLTYSQNSFQSQRAMVYELRAAGDPMSLGSAVRRALRDTDARIPIYNLVTQSKQIDQTISQERTFAILCTAFAALALLIATVGLYGMMAYRVARRTNEIGVRMALGAERRRLIWMVLREVLVMAVAGLAIGLPIAFAASRLVQSFLFQMKPNDPIALTIAPAILIAAAFLAGFGPALRASRVDPWTALRDE